VIAPSLIPNKSGERRKTNRIDATKLAKLLRACELTAIWVPDETHEALRDLVRTRSAASRDLRAKRQQVTSFLLRHGRCYPAKAWSRNHAKWLANQSFAHVAQTAAFHDMVDAVRAAQERLKRLEALIAELVPQWSLAPLVTAFKAVRGIDFISAVTFLAEVGDLTRFKTARQLMAYLGLVPCESSSGESVRHGPITKTGNKDARRTLVESAWTYRFAPKVGPAKIAKVEAASDKVQEIAWKAQMRLTKRYRALVQRKSKNIAVVAVARELSGFLWAIAREVPLSTPAGALS
jgi:transposase